VIYSLVRVITTQKHLEILTVYHIIKTVVIWELVIIFTLSRHHLRVIILLDHVKTLPLFPITNL
jgi:hypothetical protein